MYYVFYTHVNIYQYSTFDLNYIFYHQMYISNRMIYAFFSFIPPIMLNMLRFKSSVLFGTHILLDKSLRVLQLPTHLSKLTVNG